MPFKKLPLHTGVHV